MRSIEENAVASMKDGNSILEGDNFFFSILKGTARLSLTYVTQGKGMPGNIFFCFLLLFPMLLTSTSVAAEIWFVSPDNLPVRRGAGEKYKIIKMIGDGNQVKLLEEKNGWAKVQLESGTQGWMLKRRLSSDPPPPTEQMELLRVKNEELEENISQLKEDLAMLEDHQNSAGDELTTCVDQRNSVQAKYRASKEFKETSWFLYGICIPLVGWLFGRISSGSRKKRNRLL